MEREQEHVEMHLSQRLDRDAGSGLSLADYAYSYNCHEEREEEAAIPRVFARCQCLIDFPLLFLVLQAMYTSMNLP